MTDKEQDADAKQEGFLGRWSRRKAAAASESEDRESLETPSPQPLSHGRFDRSGAFTERGAKDKSLSPPLSTRERGSGGEGKDSGQDAHPLTDADMPPIETLTENSDYTGFMSPEVSEQLRKLALRKLFQGTVFKQRDGLDDYDDDFTKFEKLTKV